MGLSSAMNTSLNGLQLNEIKIDVIGNNIANAGTTGFKASSALFQTQLYKTLSVGSGPNRAEDQGGTNPRQIGLGATVASITKDFSQGSVTTTTSPSDLAIQGDGFFVIRGPEGDSYTRAGNFQLNSLNQLVDPSGLIVQGYGVDDEFNVVRTDLVDIEIPLGEVINTAEATKNVEITGALLSTGDIGTQGSFNQSQVLFQAGTATPITGATLMTNTSTASGGAASYTAGDVIEFAPRKGGRLLEPSEFTVTATSTVDDFAQFMEDVLAIVSAGVPAEDVGGTAVQPQVRVTAAGQIEVIGNRGTANDITVTSGDFVVNGSTVPISFDKSQIADGEASVTDFIIYDSLGEQIEVKLTTTLESTTNTSSTFRYYIESDEDSDASTLLGTGQIVFDSRGNVTSGGNATFSVDREDTAAVSPMQVQIDFNAVAGVSSPTAGSILSMKYQDGAEPGTLTTFAIDEAGFVNGVLDNGTVHTLGQVVLARFRNNQGLIESGANTYDVGVGSGEPVLVTPGNFGSGAILSGAVELSNTDIGKNLVDLIVASTNYRANSRVISSTQELVDELLILGR